MICGSQQPKLLFITSSFISVVAMKICNVIGKIPATSLFQCQSNSFPWLQYPATADHTWLSCHGTFLVLTVQHGSTGTRVEGYFLNSNEQIVEKTYLLTVSRWQKKSIDMTRFAVVEGTADPHTAWGLSFPETGNVLQLLLQEKTVFRYCKWSSKTDLMD